MSFSFQYCGAGVHDSSGSSVEEEKPASDLSARLPRNNNSSRGEVRLFAQQNLHDIPGQKLNQLTAQERSEGFYDVHGVSCSPVEETPELISEKLEELDSAMFHVEERGAFELAMERSPEYVQSLRLRFLRSENYQVAKAASRMALHFAFRQKYFGNETLERDLRLSDLSDHDRQLFETGFFQLCAERDRGGRAIIVQMMRKIGREPPPETAIRIFFWLVTLASNQELTQKKGVVIVEYLVSMRMEFLLNIQKRSRVPLFLEAFAAQPVRFNALHVCFDEVKMKPLISFLASMMKASYLCRLLSHFGSDVECLYSLMAFGILPNTLPVGTDGTIYTADHSRMLASVLAAENEMSTAMEFEASSFLGENDTVLSQAMGPPQPHDILMGRGKHGNKWLGNRKLRKMLEANRDAYRKGRKAEKVAISNMIYEEILNSGSRFLILSKDSKDDWILMERTEVCSRISHMLRNVHSSD